MTPLYIAALTVAPYYLDDKKWALKGMFIYKDKAGNYRWKVRKTLQISIHRAKLTERALELAGKYTVPYLSGAKADNVLTPVQKAALIHRGFLKAGSHGNYGGRHGIR